MPDDLSLRDTIESAIDSGANDGASNEVAVDSGDSSPVPEAGSPSSSEAASDTGSASESSDGKARDGKGRFAPKVAAKASTTQAPEPAGTTGTTPPKVATETATPVPLPGTESVALKAPQSWKPAERELWAKLPLEAQRAVDRREREMQAGLQEGAAERKLGQTYRETLAPFEGHIRASGGDPQQVVSGLLQTFYNLDRGSPQQKAAILANMFKAYNVPVEDFAAAIDGSGQPQQHQPAHIDPRTIAEQVERQVMERFQRQQQEQAVQRANQELADFSAKHEFFDTVRETMGGLISAKIAQNYEDAYAKACKLHPDVAPVIAQREAAKAATAQNAATQQARAAASSVKSRPAGFSSSTPQDSVRAALEAAIGERNR